MLTAENVRPCHCDVLAAAAQDLEVDVLRFFRLWNETRLPEVVLSVDALTGGMQEAVVLNCANMCAAADPDRGCFRFKARLPSGLCFAAVLRSGLPRA